MKLHLLSDLHFEHHADAGKGFIESLLPDSTVDVLMLAGDICTIEAGLFNALTMLCRKFPHVIMVPAVDTYNRARAFLANIKRTAVEQKS